MMLWAFKTSSGRVGFAYRGGWRFDACRKHTQSVGKIDWHPVRRFAEVLLTDPKTPHFYDRTERRDGRVAMYHARYAGTDGKGRPLFLSAQGSKRLAPDHCLIAFTDDHVQVRQLEDEIILRRASLTLTRMIVGID